MLISKKLIKITGHILFVITFIFFSTLEAKNLKKYDKAENISDYFSGILLLNQSKYKESLNYLKKLNGLEESHLNYSEKYLYSLINSGNFNQAFNFAKKMDLDQKNSFETDLVIGIYYFKNDKTDLAKKYLAQAKKKNSISIIEKYIANTLYIWSDIKDDNLKKVNQQINELDDRFVNLKKIQSVFLNCYFGSSDVDLFFEQLISDEKTNYSRYNYFYAKHLENENKNNRSKKIIETALKKYPRNLLLNQYKIELELKKNKSDFSCSDKNNIVAEFLYIAANALSTQLFFQKSNFYLNLSKFLNKDFHSFNTLLAENFYKIEDLTSAKKIYEKLKDNGSAFKWYSNKQIARILIQQNKKNAAIDLLTNSYNDLPTKGVYEMFDYSEFLKNNEQFTESIKYYTKILEIIDTNHPLYPQVTDGRGIAYERSGEWSKAEKDFLSSLKINPNQAYVINYLAYSWIEQGVKIEKSLEMLKKANTIKSNDPYIIDSLGWALFKLKRYKESKDYLQLAVRLMPADPIVNDHFGDVLWKNGNKIQARYYWNYVFNLQETKIDLKEKIQKKLIKGL